MSEKDTKMLPVSEGNMGEKILSILDRVGYPKDKEVDCKSLEKSASSPDSAIDLTEDNKHLCENGQDSPTDIQSYVTEILNHLIDDVCAGHRRRERKKKKEKFSDTEKWNLIKQESTIGWKRILSRNSDEEGGWGFNFISPTGLKLTVKELEKFLKKKKLDMDDLVFEAHKIELHSYPRKKAVLKMGYPVDKIRDLKLPKKLELERKRKLAQARLASQPTFKSISEFLASLDSETGQSDDTSRGTEESEDEMEESERSYSDGSFNISVDSVSEEYGHCSQIMDEVLNSVVLMSDLSSVSLISPRTRIKSLEKNMAEVQLTLSSMLQNSTPKTVERLKIKITDRVSGGLLTPEKSLTEIERLSAARVNPNQGLLTTEGAGGSCDSSNTHRIGKLKITPERLKERKSSSSQGLVSEINTPTSLKIRKPGTSPDIKLKIKTPKSQPIRKPRLSKKKSETSESSKSLTKASTTKNKPTSEKKPKKFSIFKTRNNGDEGREEMAVSFTDKTVGKSLSIRRSSKDSESKGASVKNDCTKALQIEIDQDLDTGRERVVQQSNANTSQSNPVKRNIFGAQGPPSPHQISQEKLSESQKKSDTCDKQARPASRTQSRVLSNEDAMKAIDAVVTLSEIRTEATTPLRLPSDAMSPSLTDRSKQSTPSLPAPTPTPSLPLLSPHLEESHSNMTTPSLPSLSPALPSLSPSLPRRPDGILPRRQPTPAVLDPTVSGPLSVLIPANHLNSYNSSQSSLDSSSVVATPKRKSKSKVSESPVERSATGRRMRDCRKFIHYEFSPPFASSESSVSELESPETRKDINTNTNIMKKMTKKKGRPVRTQSMTEECLSSPSSLSSNQSVGTKKRGRPVKSKSMDCREEALLIDEESNGSEICEEKKRKRGRPPKKRTSQEEDSKTSVSEFAEKLTENHISPITREKYSFPLSSPNTEERKAKLISQQRESLMMRRNSEDSKKTRKSKKTSRSKSIDVPHNLESASDLEKLKQKLEKIDSDQELLRTAGNTTPPAIVQKNNSSADVVGAKEDSVDQNSSSSEACESLAVKTLIVRKSVKVQDYSDPLMTIRDQLPKHSPPPQLLNESERAMTPPPGTCTIYQENLDLVDGLRVLTRIGPHFYPGSVKTIESPSIFAVTVDGERGNKPHIYSAEELLEKTILEVKPGSCRFTPVGTRVCVIWSKQLNFLYPATVTAVAQGGQYITVKLDDGDEREINVNNTRLLPRGYPMVASSSKESPIAVVEASTISPVPVTAIQCSPGGRKGGQLRENQFDEENSLLKLKSSGQPRKLFGQKVNNCEDSLGKKDKTGKKSLEKILKKSSYDQNDPTLTDDLLKDGQRILTLIDGHFYPGRLNATRPPDIYGVLLDNERGFRPVIYAREQLVKDCILEVKLRSCEVAAGARVCVYWSSKYQYLHPGTVIPRTEQTEKQAKYLNIVLDDGDSREIHMDQIRMMPPNFPKVVYKDTSPSPRKKSSSRPSSRADTPKSTSLGDSRPSSSLSNHSDSSKHSDCDKDLKSPLSPLKMNGTTPTPPLSRDNTPLASPVSNKLQHKLFIPEPPSKPQTFDFVGMISKGIDKLVDKKVVGNRVQSAPFARPVAPATTQPPTAAPAATKVSPPPSQDQNKLTNGDSKADNKAKSRLSNLIQAMSGKMKKPEPSSSPADQILNKWQLAFNVKPQPGTTSPAKSPEKLPSSELGQEGYLTSDNIVSGAKLLVLKSNLLYPATVVTVAVNRMFGIRFKNGSITDIHYQSESDLIKTSVFEKEANRDELKHNKRVAVVLKNNAECLHIGTIVDFKNDLIVVFLDTGVYEEVAVSNLRVLPDNYNNHKNSIKTEISDEKKEEKPALGRQSDLPKHRHKHNILLGYDFVDENDTDIVAWDRAIQRKRKSDKPKASPPLLKEDEIKEECDRFSEEPELREDSPETITAEVKESMQSMLDQVSLEDRMRISLLSSALKKHSPKKEVAGNKSPKQNTEVVRKERKRKGSRDSLPKRLSLEDDDLSSELISICKESNIDISKQGQVQEEDKGDDNLNTSDGDSLTIIEDKEDMEADQDKKDEESSDTEKTENVEEDEKKVMPGVNGKIVTKIFSYTDPGLPPDWYVIIRRRGKACSSQYVSPCHTRLKSLQEVEKFLRGDIPSKPMHKKRQSTATLPTRDALAKDEFDLTIDLGGDFLSKLKSAELIKPARKIKKKKTDEKKSADKKSVNNDPSDDKEEDKEKPPVSKGRKKKAVKKEISEEDDEDENNQQKDHVFKVPSLESFRSQKNKSSKLLSPNSAYEESSDFDELSQEQIETEAETENPDLERVEGTEGSDPEEQEGLNRKKATNSRKSRVGSDESETGEDDSSRDEMELKSTKTKPKKQQSASKRKTRSQSTSESESETEEETKSLDIKNQSQSETSGSENECEDNGPRKKKKRQNKKMKEEIGTETGTGSDKENESLSQVLEQVESEPLNGKITNKSLKGRKQNNSEQESLDEPTKRTLRSKTGDSKKIESVSGSSDSNIDSSSEEVKKRSLRSSSESHQEPTNDVDNHLEDGNKRTLRSKDSRSEDNLDEKDEVEQDKKRKASEDPEDERPSKKLLIIDETLTDETPENNNSESEVNLKTKKPKRKLLGPRSKRKSYEPGEDEDSNEEPVEELSNKIEDMTTLFFQKKKQTKCNIGMTSLFQSSLCKAACGHCSEVGQYKIHLVDFDITRKIVSMECTVCHWTTVRRMTITTKVLG